MHRKGIRPNSGWKSHTTPSHKECGRKPIGLERNASVGYPTSKQKKPCTTHEPCISLGRELPPDETTICHFWYLIETHNFDDGLFRLEKVYLDENGLKVNRGTIDKMCYFFEPSLEAA